MSTSLNLHRVTRPDFWMDKDGQHPAPFTVIRRDDIHEGKYLPVSGMSQSDTLWHYFNVPNRVAIRIEPIQRPWLACMLIAFLFVAGMVAFARWFPIPAV